MRNHSLLYITTLASEPGEFELLAESNSVLPSLWKVLLANATLAAPATVREVGHSGALLVVDAQDALRRANIVREVLCDAPIVEEVPGLLRYLSGVQQHLETTMDAWRHADSMPMFVVSFDELARPAGVSLDDFGLQLRTTIAMDWQKSRGASRRRRRGY